MRRSMFVAVLLTVAGGFSSAAGAADFGAIPYVPPVSGPAPIVELGTGWYLRGDIGGGFETQVQLNPDVPAASKKMAWTGDIGVGYKFNSYLRTDLTLDYFQPQHINSHGTQPSICPYMLQGVTVEKYITGYPPVNLGYLYSPQAGTCTSAGSIDVAQTAAFANVYGDLGTYLGVTPYLGGGLGLSQIQYTARSDYYKTSDGSSYRANLTPTGSFPLLWVDSFGNPISPQPSTPSGSSLSFAKQDYSRSIKKTTYALAFNLTGGFAYSLTDHAAIDVNYRYVNNGTYVSLPGNNSAAIRKALETHQVRVGFRYLID